MTEYEWGDASVTFPDWIGTAQLDQKVTTDLYSLTGIESNEWQIVGLDFGGGDMRMHNLRVIAVPRSEWRQSTPSDLSNVQATSIEINNGIDPFELLRQIMHLFDMRLRFHTVKDATITITDTLVSPPRTESS
jgi:hypothetical protein